MSTTPLIRVSGLTKSFGDNHVLRGVDFEAGRGTVTTILGPSGLTLEEPTGRIELDAEEAGTVSRGNVARAIVTALENPGTSGTFLPFNDGEQEIREAFRARS